MKVCLVDDDDEITIYGHDLFLVDEEEKALVDHQAFLIDPPDCCFLPLSPQAK